MMILRLASFAIALLLAFPVAAAEPQSYRYVAASGLTVEGQHSGGCGSPMTLGVVVTPYRGGVCLDVEPGTYTITVVDDVLGPVAFTAKGDGPRETVLVVGVAVERTSDCGVFVKAEGYAVVTIPEGCFGLDIHVDAGSVAGTITVA